MNDHDDREERAILAALDCLKSLDADPPARPDAADAEDAGAGTETEATLRRLSVETLGLLPWAIEPEAPSAGAIERLLAALPVSHAAPGAPVRSIGSARHRAAPATSSSPESVPAPAPRRRAWPAALAAGLVVAALGLAGVAGWLWIELGEARSQLAQAQGALAGSEIDRGQLADRVASQEAQLRRHAGMEKFVTAASTAGVEICPLRPVGDPALHPEAFGVLYMPPGSGKWYLVASNLRPGDHGTYTVWLNTPDGPVEVGRLDAGEDSALEFELPPDVDARHELMLSIVVTLEPEPGTSVPTGPPILFGDEKMQIL